MSWKNRIVGHGEQAAISFMANPLNWRIHPKAQREALTGVLSEVGWVQSVIVNRTTGNVIDGHARIEEALKLGDETPVPFVEVELSEDEEQKILLTLDPISAMAAADKQNLDALLQDVSTASSAVADMLTELAEKNGLEYGATIGGDLEDVEPQVDRADELRQKWGVESGQIWQLGEHRLMCGDSTKAEDVARLMNEKKADLCFTSPPYGQQRDYTEESKEKVSDWDGLMRGVFGNLPMSDAGQVLVNLGMIHKDGEWIPYWESWIEWMRSQGWKRFGWYVWDQRDGLPGHWQGRFAPSHEFIFHFTKSPIQPTKFVPCKTAGKVNSSGSALKSSGKSGKSAVWETAETKIPDSVIRVPRARSVGVEHPAIFPVEFAAFAIQCWQGVAYEPFSGSGTTIMAAEQLERKCYAMEIAPAYVAVALERWSQATGKTPELVA